MYEWWKKKIQKVTAGDKKASKDSDIKGFTQDLDKSLKAAKKNAVKNTVPDDDEEESDVEDLDDIEDDESGDDIGQIDLDAEDGEDEELDSDDQSDDKDDELMKKLA